MPDSSPHTAERDEEEEATQQQQQALAKTCLVWKFCFYGFFKNLQLFESFLWATLLSWGVSLLQIGLLTSVIEGITYAFEVPSGIVADNFGKKRQLLVCFGFYIASFVAYGCGRGSFGILLLASMLYGLGEAFRSGTHKAMILQHLEREGLLKHKAFVYGRTRSFSNLGSALSAVLGTLCVVFSPDLVAIFWVSVLPFIADFFLVASYPSYMNEVAGGEEAPPGNNCLKDSVLKPLSNLRAVLADPLKRRAIASSSLGVALFKSSKHFVQPVVLLYLSRLPGGAESTTGTLLTDDAAVILGVLYTIYFLLSSLASKYSYIVLKRCGGAEKFAMDWLLMIFAGVAGSIGLTLQLQLPLVAVLLYSLLYITHNIRKPISSIMVAELGGKKQRATLLSVEALLAAISASVLAPLLAYIAEAWSMAGLFLAIAVGSIVINMCLWGAAIEADVDDKDSPQLETADTEATGCEEEGAAIPLVGMDVLANNVSNEDSEERNFVDEDEFEQEPKQCQAAC